MSVKRKLEYLYDLTYSSDEEDIHKPKKRPYIETQDVETQEGETQDVETPLETQDGETQDVETQDVETPVEECYGCRNDEGNQLSHMNIGGCLYDPSNWY